MSARAAQIDFIRAAHGARANARTPLHAPPQVSRFPAFSVAKNALQGAAAGLLLFVGSLTLAEGVEIDAELLSGALSMDAAALKAVSAAILSGGGPGVVEILGAGALFLNAGAGWARIVGLMSFVAIALASANGAEVETLLPQLTELLERAELIVQGAFTHLGPIIEQLLSEPQ